MFGSHTRINRRRVLALGGALAVALLPPGPLAPAAAARQLDDPSEARSGDLPVPQIEKMMQTTGTMHDGVLTIDLERTDLSVTGPHGIPFKPAFELTHEFHFQSLGNGRAFLNAELTFIEREMTAVVDALFAQGLILMAQHQHFIGEKPQTWHYHFRGSGDPLHLAAAAIAVVKATGTPLPQPQPSAPKTPLPQDQLAHILGGTAQVGSDGVVTISVPRAGTIYLAGVALKPEMGVQHTIAFEPLGSGRAACAPDYALTAPEVQRALTRSRAVGFEVHCLYNQETAESPQLYFSHNLATGTPLDLARRVRTVLDTTHVRRA